MTETPPEAPKAPDEKNNNNGSALTWHVLGGNNKHRIGANAGLVTYEETKEDGTKKTVRFMIDAGSLIGQSRTPEYPELATSDNVIPDMSKHFKLKGSNDQPEEPVDGIFITHNHVDHAGAIPFYVMQGYELPKIYATPYTIKRIEQELTNANIDPDVWPDMVSIAPGHPVQEGNMKVNPFWVSHSTPQSVGYFIETPEGTILHPGDFKLDTSVVWGPSFNKQQFEKMLEGKSVDLLLLDSTGADADHETIHEQDVRDTLKDLMAKNPGKRFIIAVSSGYEENVASVAQVSAEAGRTLWIAGWAHEQSMSALKATGMTMSDALGKEIQVRMLDRGKPAKDLEEAKPGSSVVIVTGAAGTPSSVLPRAAEGKHPSLKLDKDKDIILIVAPAFPGQEASRNAMLSSLRKQGYKVITKSEEKLYSHAHARQPELVEFAKLAKPKTVLPVHGDTHLRAANKAAMEKAGMTAIEAENGDTLKVTKTGVSSTNPASKGRPKLVGFKTLQGRTWSDKNYVQINAPQENTQAQAPANDDGKSAKPKTPRIFTVVPPKP